MMYIHQFGTREADNVATIYTCRYTTIPSASKFQGVEGHPESDLFKRHIRICYNEIDAYV